MSERSGPKHRIELTSRGLSGFAPLADMDIVWDATLAGFGLRTRGKAEKDGWRWIFKYREEATGKQIKVTLGSFLDLTPEKARKAAIRAEAIRKEKLDKRAEGDAERAARREAKAKAEAEKARPTVTALWERYWAAKAQFKKSAEDDAQRWRDHLKPAFGAIKVADVSPERVEEFKAGMAGTPGACNRSLALLSSMMTKAVLWGYRAGCPQPNPVKGVERYPEKKSRFYYPEEELGRILNAADTDYERSRERIRVALEELEGRTDAKARRRRQLISKWEVNPAEGLALRMVAQTGARPGEVVSAHWRQFHPLPDDRLMWIVEDSKGGEPISRALDADLSAKLLGWKDKTLTVERVLATTPGTPLWVFTQRDNPSNHIVRLTNCWARVKKVAGVEGRRIYDLRHTVGSYLTLHTGGLAAAQFQLGHATPTTTKRYAHLVTSGMINTGDLLGKITSEAQAKANAAEPKVVSIVDRRTG